jgi:hypothetical protein
MPTNVSDAPTLLLILVVGGRLSDSYRAGRFPERIYASVFTLLLIILWQ